MAQVDVNGVRLFYEETGAGDETILFSHGLLMNHHMFDDQVNHFRGRYRCIAYDHRGQGQSSVPKSGYDIETIYEDAVKLIESLNIAPCHFVGLSTGGFVGMRLAARRPDLLKSLVLMETSADEEPAENLPRYNLLVFVARWFGVRWVVNGAAKTLFGKTFRTDPVYADRYQTWLDRLRQVDRLGAVRSAKGVFTRKSVYDEIAGTEVPTLVIVGEEDVATVPAKAERIHEQIAGSRLVYIPKAGHSSSVEQPDLVCEAMDEFYAFSGAVSYGDCRGKL